MTRKTMLLFAVSLVIAAATPAMAKNERAKTDRNTQSTRASVEQMAPPVGGKSVNPVPAPWVARAYQDAVHLDADRQMNRGL